MPAITTKPYKCPPASIAVVKQWWLAGESLKPLPERIAGWDYSTDLIIMCEVEVDVHELYRHTELPTDTPLSIALTWKATTFSKGRGEVEPILPHGGKNLVQLNLHIAGNQAGGSVEVACVIALLKTVPQFPGIAKQPGSILWDSKRTLHLEGSSSRFPIQIIDFAAAGLPSSGYWNLSWHPYDMECPFLSNVTLRLNGARAEILKLSAGDPDPVFASMLNFDVARQLLRGALSNEEFRTHCGKYSEGTTGSALSALLYRFQGDYDAEGAASMLANNAEYFDTLLQARLSFLNEPIVSAD